MDASARGADPTRPVAGDRSQAGVSTAASRALDVGRNAPAPDGDLAMPPHVARFLPRWDAMALEPPLAAPRALDAATAPRYVIARATPQDSARLRDLLARWVTVQNAAARYDWLYHENPQGRAATWIAWESECAEPVGFTSIMPRDYVVRGRSITAGVGLDAFVRPDHRRRGLAVALHRASSADMRQRRVPSRFMCGPPVRANLEALLKAGAQVVGDVRYLTLPLTGQGLASLLRFYKPIPGTALLNPLVRALRVGAKKRRYVTARRVDRIGRDFDRLWERLAPFFGVIGRRDGAYLDWRYLRNPVCQIDLFALERAGLFLGWAALEFAPKGCLLVDWLFWPEEDLAAEALDGVIETVARCGSPRLTVRINHDSQYTAAFRTRGFLKGWHADRFQVLCPEPQLQAELRDFRHWHFAAGDLNPEATPWSVNTSPRAPWAGPDYVGQLKD
jgi:GNAT superfamily N-acetyltransferase